MTNKAYSTGPHLRLELELISGLLLFETFLEVNYNNVCPHL